MTTHVFILQTHTGTRFLLGSSKDLAADLKYLAPSQFDLSRSVIFALPDPSASAQLVGALQHAFASFAVIGPAHPGMMWFERSTLSRMLKFLVDVGDLMPHQLVSHPVQRVAEQERLIRQRWPEEKLKQLHEQHERSKQSVEIEAERTGHVLAKLIERSRFVAVVRTLKGFVLVGEAVNGCEHYIDEALDNLMSSSSGINEYDQWGGVDGEAPPYYAAEIGFRPGQDGSKIENYFGWCEHLVWTQQSGIPGLDTTLGWQDAKRAAELLEKCPRPYAG